MGKTCSIKIYGCHGLPKIKGSKPNAFAALVGDCATRTYIGSTKAIKSQDPEWNETFNFDFCLANTILVQLVHKKFGFDIDIGVAVVDLLNIQNGDKFTVPIKPLTKEEFSGTVDVSVSFGFPDLEEKETTIDHCYLFATAAFDPPIQIPPSAPMPVKLKCLSYNKKKGTFNVFDEKSYGFDGVISSGNKMVFTGSGFSQVYMLIRKRLSNHKVLFLIESDNYDGIVTINIGMKKYQTFPYDCGPNVFFLNGDYEIFKSFQMEVVSKQYTSSSIYLSFKKFEAVKVHNNDIMTINSGEDPNLFE